jgi:hypothetical protein
MNYKVVSLTVSGLGKKIHRNGDTVTDADFPQGRAKELVKLGFLKEAGESEVVKAILNVASIVSNVDKNSDDVIDKNEDDNILDKIAKNNAPKKTSKK